MPDVAVIVPVLGRPEHAARFCGSFFVSTPPNRARVVPVMSDHDPIDDKTWDTTWEAWEQAGTEPWLIEGVGSHTFAAKVNYGYQITEEPWLLLVGTDVVFQPRWLESALITAELSGAKLVATNDLHNPAVMQGRHATHPLIARAYIDEVGASWDGPGMVCHEGYAHCWVDNEFSQAAQDRGVFAYSSLSIIEHLHPVWGTGEDDEVYRLGKSSEDADEALFMERWRRYGVKP